MTLFSPEIQLHPKAVMDSLQDTPARVEALSELSRFRAGLHACFTRRGDVLFELADAVLCAQGPVRSPVELSLEPEFRRRHGSVYDALAHGRISGSRLRHLLVGLSAPARAGEPLMFAIDTTPHPRPDAEYAEYADERTMVQVRGKGGDRWLPGWPYSLLVGIQWGSSSWADRIAARLAATGDAIDGLGALWLAHQSAEAESSARRAQFVAAAEVAKNERTVDRYGRISNQELARLMGKSVQALGQMLGTGQ